MDIYRSISRLMAALAHPVRLRILNILAIEPTFVCDLVDQTGYRQANISQQLAILREANLVDFVREGPRVKYFLLMPSAMRMIELAGQSSSFIKSKNATQKLSAKDGVWQGISLERINWQPKLIMNRCDGCGMCVISCLQGVYGFNYVENQPVIVHSAACTMGCTTCASVCLQDAIRFPVSKIRRLVKQARFQRQAKRIIKAERQKYDVKGFEITAG